MENSALTEIDKLEPCPRCESIETAEVIAAIAEAHLDVGALWLSGVILILMLSSHIFFAYHGKVLPIPEIVWVVTLAPWIGKSGSKIVDLLDRYKTGDKA